MRSHRDSTGLKAFLYGVPYYPEHWDDALRACDPGLLAGAGFNVVRMAEFAWDLMESEEGVYDFSLFDETITAMAARGLQTILCTPTAAPPRWLSAVHPEILRIDEKGLPQVHGSRQHASHFSTVFRERSRAITAAMAAHFKDNAHVIGWQTDNEFHCHFSQDHCADARRDFREFLRERYGNDIGRLNTAWGTRFWSQTYRDFAEIETPKNHRPTHVNPSQMLDYHRFLSFGATRFQREQVDILRAANPRWWITHNGCFASIDFRGPFTGDLDFLSYDSYPFFDYDPEARRYSHAFNLDYVRGHSGNFVVMEQQSGPGGQGDYLHDTPEPGEMRRMAYTGIARGADGILFFRERSCRFGAEEYWCGILDHDNVPRRRYREAAQLGGELRAVGPAIMGSHVVCDIGIAGADFDSHYGHLPLSHGLPTPRKAAEGIHTCFHKKKHAVGIVHPEDDLRGLRVYILPHIAQFKPEWVPALEAFLAGGGTLIIGARTACKDLNNHVISETLPGCLRALAGITVEEFGKQNAPEQRPLVMACGDARIRTSLWYERLHPVDAQTEVIATWHTRHLAGSPAITARSHGRGRTIYVGSYFNDDLLDAVYGWLSDNGHLPAAYAYPAPIEVVQRQRADGGRVTFLIHHGSEPVTVSIKGTDLISGTKNNTLCLGPNDVAVVVDGKA